VQLGKLDLQLNLEDAQGFGLPVGQPPLILEYRMNIKLMRLSTGEDLIGDLKNNDAAGVLIENPCIVYLSQNPEGGPANLGMTRWMPYADNKEFLIDAKFIVTIAEPVDELAKQYDGVFGAGLIVPSSKLEVVK
jgi:hypothetical protein